MLAVVLAILKILGLILLCMVGLVIVVLLLVLFVPVRYKLDAFFDKLDFTKEDIDYKDIIKAAFSFSWLLHLINGGISFPDKMYFYLRIAVFQVFPQKESSGKTNLLEKQIEEENKNTDIHSSAGSLETQNSQNITESEKTEESEYSQNIEADFDESAEDNKNEDAENSENYRLNDNYTGEDSDNSEGLWEKLLEFVEKIKNKLNNLQNVFDNFKCTISRVYDKIDMVKKTIENDIFQRAFVKVKKHLIIILKVLLPRQIEADLTVGTGDPASTAQIMGGLGVLRGFGIKKVYITPDFENTIVDGEIHIKGKITLFRIILSLAICYFNKDIRKTIKRFNKIINS
ncbi:MAG: DUF2953 domain-containing protein [Butyrivibrio sp.]|nr:DUF2953 domain-containing protein [Butyrivibrio sp.]